MPVAKESFSANDKDAEDTHLANTSNMDLSLSIHAKFLNARDRTTPKHTQTLANKLSPNPCGPNGAHNT